MGVPEQLYSGWEFKMADKEKEKWRIWAYCTLRNKTKWNEILTLRNKIFTLQNENLDLADNFVVTILFNVLDYSTELFWAVACWPTWSELSKVRKSYRKIIRKWTKIKFDYKENKVHCAVYIAWGTSHRLRQMFCYQND